MSITQGSSIVADAVVSKAAWYRSQKYNERHPLTIAIHHPRQKQVQAIVDALPSVRRMSYHHDYLALVEKTDDISTENIIGAMRYVNLPEERFWIEGPHFQCPDNSNMGVGALISKIPENGFSFLLATIHQNEKAPKPKAVIFDIEPTVSPTNGIVLDDKKLLGLIENLEKWYKATDHSQMIDYYYQAADFFCRLFVIMNSTNIGSNFNEAKTSEEIDLEQKNLKRKKVNRPPILATRPIIIDPTRTDKRLQDPTSKVSLEEFLGTTPVRPSKFITRPDGSLWIRKKDGMPWFRKKHERKIRAAVDRIGPTVPFILTAQRAAGAEIKFSPDRPLIIRNFDKVNTNNAGQ